MVSLQGCSIIVLASIILMSGCLSGRTAQLYDSYSKASVKDDAISAIIGTDFCKERGCMLVSCGDPIIMSDNSTKIKCDYRTDIESSKRYNLDVFMSGGVINDIKYNGTTIR
jgi:hypothetical protein